MERECSPFHPSLFESQLAPDGVGKSDVALATEIIETLESLEVEDADPSLEDIEEQPLRLDLIDRVLGTIRADATRAEGSIRREDIEKQCFRRSLSISECVQVESALTDSGITIIESQLKYDSRALDIGSGNDRFRVHGRSRFLTESEERELGRKIQRFIQAKESSSFPEDLFAKLRQDATDAKAIFIETNVRWLKQTASHFAHTKHLTQEDLFQEGIFGLIRAAELWDPRRGYRFKTYAGWWITQKMHRAIADGDRMVRLPVHVIEKVRRVKRISRILLLRSGEEPTINLLAVTLGMDKERLAQLLSMVEATECLDGDAPITDRTEDDNGTSLFTLVADGQLPSAFDLAYRDELIKIIMSRLKKREARVILMRFGFHSDGERTLEAIGQQMRLTRERVRQIEEKALEKLKPILVKVVYERAIDHGGVFRTWGGRASGTIRTNRSG